MSCCSRAESIEGKHILITGGSAGLGLALAKLCAEKGAKISILAVTQSKLDAAKAAILKADPSAQVEAVSADVTDSEALARAVAATEEKLGPIEFCVAAAGYSIPKYFEDLTKDDFKQMMEVDYFGVVNLAQIVLPGMTSRNSGHFCAVSSEAAAVPFIGYAAYAPAKAAVKSFIDCMRNEFADTKVQFHIAFPPDMDTPGFHHEEETKPYETKHMWPQCFNELYSPESVAKDLMHDMLNGRYFISSPDCFGNLLVDRSWGQYPRKCALCSSIIAPFFVCVQSLMVCWQDGVVRRHKHHSILQGSEEESSEGQSSQL